MNAYAAGPFLSQIDFPEDLRAKFKPEELQQVSDELRQFIVDVVSEKGGHFGASLGVVELTVALHYVFNTPEDQIVWDVGHQAYGHDASVSTPTVSTTASAASPSEAKANTTRLAWGTAARALAPHSAWPSAAATTASATCNMWPSSEMGP